MVIMAAPGRAIITPNMSQTVPNIAHNTAPTSVITSTSKGDTSRTFPIT